jgi:hypothetical protein
MSPVPPQKDPALFLKLAGGHMMWPRDRQYAYIKNIQFRSRLSAVGEPTHDRVPRYPNAELAKRTGVGSIYAAPLLAGI